MTIPRNTKFKIIKCWSCNKEVLSKDIIRRKCDTIFDWKCYGAVDLCKECDYWIDHIPKCPKCGEKTNRRLRYKDWLGEYKEFKSLRFRCFKCCVNYRVKKKK